MNRAACERRVYRLATLLTGNPQLAAGVITAVIDAQPDVSRLDGQHMDRLTVLRSREISPGVLLDAQGVPKEVARALAELPQQHREAWVFARVYRMEVRQMARAMDCSTTAMELHLELADKAMAARLGVEQAAQAPAQLLAYTANLDVPMLYRSAKGTKRIMKRLVIGMAVLVLLTSVFFVARWLAMRASDTLTQVEHGEQAEIHPEN